MRALTTMLYEHCRAAAIAQGAAAIERMGVIGTTQGVRAPQTVPPRSSYLISATKRATAIGGEWWKNFRGCGIITIPEIDPAAGTV